jgi:hypothetical protein
MLNNVRDDMKTFNNLGLGGVVAGIRALGCLQRSAVLLSILGYLPSLLAHAETSATASSIPAAAGDSVKSGDLILWQVNKPITFNEPTAATPAEPAAAATANTGDAVAAAQAIVNATLGLVEVPGPPAPGAQQGIVDSYNARYGAYNQAQDLLSAAKKADAKALAASRAGTLIAINSDLDDAQKSLNETAAKRPIAPGKTESQKVAAAKAEADWSQALAYYMGVSEAFQKIAASPPSQTDAPAKNAVHDAVCFPRNGLFSVTSVVAATKASVGAGSTSADGNSAIVSNTQLVSGHFASNPGVFHPLNVNRHMPTSSGDNPQSACGSDATRSALADKDYSFTADQLDKQDFYREGFTWGGLVIPYKFYFKDKSIKSNSSVVAFAGYEGWFPGVSLAAVAAAGAGTSQTPTTTTNATGTTATSTATTATYTAAIGVIATFGGTTKAGLMFGRDYQGNASAFPYENKTWMALSIGAGF